MSGPVSAVADAHMIYEPPFRYIFHTIRWLIDDRRGGEGAEDIGVQIAIAVRAPGIFLFISVPFLLRLLVQSRFCDSHSGHLSDHPTIQKTHAFFCGHYFAD
eukprot:SAG31_NODE_707_length_12684_cov_16.884863_15_plen_102_part_00